MILTCHCGLTRNVADCPCGQPTFSEAELIELENAVLTSWQFSADEAAGYGRSDRIVSTLTRLIALARTGDPTTPLDRELRHTEYLNSEFARIQATYPLAPKEGKC